MRLRVPNGEWHSSRRPHSHPASKAQSGTRRTDERQDGASDHLQGEPTALASGVGLERALVSAPHRRPSSVGRPLGISFAVILVLATFGGFATTFGVMQSCTDAFSCTVTRCSPCATTARPGEHRPVDHIHRAGDPQLLTTCPDGGRRRPGANGDLLTLQRYKAPLADQSPPAPTRWYRRGARPSLAMRCWRMRSAQVSSSA